ncbi:hypothetical protein WJ0W_006500 [Paenibacillus melissococcoides]|uniref:Uncharacterized protein n=1 Tax=Paenibacillus melissococcoides TaxID=2912268 RepID=A0ABN8UDM8_9BACL|nr:MULTISPECIES: hypothetical protein [Paenibacillus]MEB9894497.1 hypothetical protein [Bacillus cereus]QVQ56266.1 hypothetical protein [Paenibacillus phage Pd_22F]GIO76802.1 hypothetical protein J6TS7_04120 [Paenibacillus dendritiformis]CAH8249314.1 hypothetical protein WJ0W_006500 [Paenibacillus melissococcoides]
MSNIEAVKEEWIKRKEEVKLMRAESKNKLRELLESGIDEVKLTLRDFTIMHEEELFSSDSLELLEEALDLIVAGAENPVEIAKAALNKYRGEE